MPQALPRPTHLPPAEPCSNPDLTDIEESACSSPPAASPHDPHRMSEEPVIFLPFSVYTSTFTPAVCLTVLRIRTFELLTSV